MEVEQSWVVNVAGCCESSMVCKNLYVPLLTRGRCVGRWRCAWRQCSGVHDRDVVSDRRWRRRRHAHELSARCVRRNSRCDNSIDADARTGSQWGEADFARACTRILRMWQRCRLRSRQHCDVTAHVSVPMSVANVDDRNNTFCLAGGGALIGQTWRTAT